MDDDVVADTSRLRRVPQQSRSRERVEKILNIAAEQVVRNGVESLGTRSIAEAADVPVASLYQYFADKDDILLALVERDIELMDEEVAKALESLPQLDVPTIVESIMDAFVRVFPQRPAFIMIWLRGRTNEAIRQFVREHDRQMAEDLYKFATNQGLLTDDATPRHVELAIEVGDRLFQLAYENSLDGDPMILEEAPRLVAGYLERYATDTGRRQTAD